MTQEDLNKYKEVLEKSKADLEKEMKSVPLVEDMGNDTEGDSFDEEADEAEQMVNNAAVRFTLKERLQAINAALEKIGRGDYGKCKDCDKEINKEVLDVDPESKNCKDCKN